jgi:2-oxoglutarate ferredoxin oxidoreductase subunit beta
MVKRQEHPIDAFLNLENLPTVWCPGCGIGIVVNTFIQTINKMKYDTNQVTIVSSGISCTGKISDHLNLKLVESENPFRQAAKFKKRNPQTRVVLFFNDNDLIVSGLNGLKKACREGLDIVAVCINSFVCNILFFHKKYKGFSENIFNLPSLMHTCGASYIARWTPLHCRRLSYSLKEALLKQGFSFIEVISPCLMYYASSGYQGKTIDRMGDYLKNAEIDNDSSIENLYVKDLEHIIIGKFLDRS